MAIRYGFLPRREKQLESLDPEPFLYPSTHPCLAEAMHRSYSSDVWDEERVSELKRRAAEGKSACRFREADLWPVLVKEGIRPDCPCFEDRVLSFAKSSGGPGMINFVLSHFDELKNPSSSENKSAGARRSGSEAMCVRRPMERGSARVAHANRDRSWTAGSSHFQCAEVRTSLLSAMQASLLPQCSFPFV